MDAREIIEETMLEMQDGIPQRLAQLNEIDSMLNATIARRSLLERDLSELTPQADFLLKHEARKATRMLNEITEKRDALHMIEQKQQSLTSLHAQLQRDFESYVIERRKTIRENQMLLDKTAFKALRVEMARVLSA